MGTVSAPTCLQPRGKLTPKPQRGIRLCLAGDGVPRQSRELVATEEGFGAAVLRCWSPALVSIMMIS